MALSSISPLSAVSTASRSQALSTPFDAGTASQKYSLDQFFAMLRSQASSPEELAVINQAWSEAQKLFRTGEIGSESAAPSDQVLAWFRIGSGYTPEQGLPKSTGEAIDLFESIVRKKIAAVKKKDSVDLILYMVRTIFPPKNPHAVVQSKEASEKERQKDATQKAVDRARELWG